MGDFPEDFTHEFNLTCFFLIPQEGRGTKRTTTGMEWDI